MATAHLTTTNFSTFNLPEPLIKGITKAGFSFCTPIQAATLPISLQGQDVAGQAQTGTGKTAAFLVATFNHLLNRPPTKSRQHNEPRALIVAPTRELAIQIFKEAEVLGEFLSFRLGLAYGGSSMHQQRELFTQGVDILIATPGRLIDCFRQNWTNFDAVEVMVLDEADRMFDLGFIKQIRFVLRRLPPATQRLNLLFSATLSYRVMELAYEHMNHPQRVSTSEERTDKPRITEQAYYVANNEKLSLLLGIIRDAAPQRAIVFVNTKRVGEELGHQLSANKLRAGVLSGDVPQQKRMSLLNQFKNGEIDFLVATDVAARGLHIPEVSHVFNYDLPQDSEEYVHRIGRTARIGAEGVAISFVCEEYAYHLPDIEQYIGHKIPPFTVTESLLAAPVPSERKRSPRRGGHRQQRPSGQRFSKG